MPDEPVIFDRAAGFYDETRGLPPGEDGPIAALIAKAGGLTARSRVLDAGVGTGRIALPLAEHVQAVHGVDLSRLMMERLREKQNDQSVYIALGDVTRLPCAGQCFDAVVALNIFHLVPDLGSAITEVARVLRPGGSLLYCQNYHESPLDELRQAWRTAIPRSRERDAAWNRIGSHLAQGGWRRVDDGQYVHTFRWGKAPQTMVDEFRNRVWSATWRLSDDEIAQGADAMERVMRERFTDPRAPVEVEERFVVSVYMLLT